MSKKKKHSHNNEMKNLLHQLIQANEANVERVTSQNNQLLEEIAFVHRNMDEMKTVLARLKPVAPSTRRGGLFSRRPRNVPITVEPEVKQKPLSLPIEELLPLLPQLGGVIPQLNNPKVRDTMKILGNPAVMGMIQQFLANGGLKGIAGIAGKTGVKGKTGIIGKTQALPKGRGFGR
ncbi:hypothetical protein ACQCN2_21995 [Brevibacillus ginsengisoli]|uniref:hypothetical protein n=1 Tax=Brevibacillus ginsengisoli TaxID=363854 RepID=UPI003CEC2723